MIFYYDCRVTIVPNTAIYFTIYEQLKSKSGYTHGTHSALLTPLLCGGTARGTALTALTHSLIVICHMSNTIRLTI